MQKIIISFLASLFFLSFSVLAENKYVGAKMCGMCHKGEKKGAQFEIWQKSKHADAYKILTSAKSAEIATAKGLKKPANESPECLECHAMSNDPKLIVDGVQCESCHGAGSAYKTLPVMKDKAKAIAAGLMVFKDEEAIADKCKTCHNEKSPTRKSFKYEQTWFKDMWAKIKHSIPKG
jgi:hypothetical protein